MDELHAYMLGPMGINATACVSLRNNVFASISDLPIPLVLV